MKEIKRFENSERLVRLTHNESENTYLVTIFAKKGKCRGETYKSLWWAQRMFLHFKNTPLDHLKLR